MWSIVRVFLLTAVVAVAGCSLFHEPRVSVAEITSITAPDTAHAETTFNVTARAFFACDLSRVFDHVEVSYTNKSMDIRVWSRSNEGGAAIQVVSERDLTFEGRSLEPGEYRVIAHQPDGSTTQKTITVLP